MTENLIKGWVFLASASTSVAFLGETSESVIGELLPWHELLFEGRIDMFVETFSTATFLLDQGCMGMQIDASYEALQRWFEEVAGETTCAPDALDASPANQAF